MANRHRPAVPRWPGRHSRWAALTLLLIVLLNQPAAAHRGPPFPVLMDRALAHSPYVLSIWADPDIGDARFFVILERKPESSAAAEVPALRFWVEPLSGRLARKSYPAVRQDLRRQIQFVANPYFDQRDQWKVGVEVGEPNRAMDEVMLTIESTLPGLGVWDLALYVFPFVLFGGLWALTLLRRHRRVSPSSQG